MRIALQLNPDNGVRLVVPISEFSFAAYPVHINRLFRCLAGATRIQTHSLGRRKITQRVSHRVVGFLSTPGIRPVAVKAGDPSRLNGFRLRLRAAEAARSSSAEIPAGLKAGVNDTPVKRSV